MILGSDAYEDFLNGRLANTAGPSNSKRFRHALSSTAREERHSSRDSEEDMLSDNLSTILEPNSGTRKSILIFEFEWLNLTYLILGLHHPNSFSSPKSRRQSGAVLPKNIIDFIAESRLEQAKIMTMITSLATRPKASGEEIEDDDMDDINFPLDDNEEFSALLSRLEDRSYRKRLVSNVLF